MIPDAADPRLVASADDVVARYGEHAATFVRRLAGAHDPEVSGSWREVLGILVEREQRRHLLPACPITS